MGLETVTYIGDLVNTNPPGSDQKSQGDDHLRNIKKADLNSFAGYTGPILVTGVDGGAADAYTLTPANALPSYVAKMTVLFVPNATNLTTTPTLNISGLGAMTIKSVVGAALTAGDLVAGKPYFAEYDGAALNLISITKNYVDQLAFNTALPAQVADYFLTSNGAVASFSNALKATVIRFKDGADATKLLAFDLTGITTGTTRTVAIPNKSGTMAMTSDLGLTFLTAITPTAAANIDFLTTFTAAYDNYLIQGAGITTATTAALCIRAATAGAADANSVYYQSTPYSAGPTSTAVALFTSNSNTFATGKGLTFEIRVRNCNDATRLKTITYESAGQSATTPAFAFGQETVIYSAANTMSGLRLFWTGGALFGATGTIRIYGYNNS